MTSQVVSAGPRRPPLSSWHEGQAGFSSRNPVVSTHTGVPTTSLAPESLVRTVDHPQPPTGSVVGDEGRYL